MDRFCKRTPRESVCKGVWWSCFARACWFGTTQRCFSTSELAQLRRGLICGDFVEKTAPEVSLGSEGNTVPKNNGQQGSTIARHCATDRLGTRTALIFQTGGAGLCSFIADELRRAGLARRAQKLDWRFVR